MKPAKYVITPEAHEQIRRVYQSDTGAGQVRDLARRLHLPRWKVSRYALHQGWVAKQPKEPNWSDAELSYLQRVAHLHPEVIQRKMKANGYKRSVNGIVLKLRRTRMLKNLEGMSARSVALCLGVDDKHIRRLIDSGRLKATRRGTARTEAQGGDQWWIKEQDVRAYILEYLPEVDLRKADKYWLVDLLAHGEAA
ncbi:hypothetical protein SAMN05660653_00160 [Desulfonatronum thiosulfatophilum]|uniref:Helix-turn-helix domain-containing protein n=1 Tax=Desulfonatronum thiosulfatophilum TaxID=617002 RepID=A0A1G6A547_9BACT|nr:helix-turn-helix domain-containing protein [Desulfonatronum thiosulfatophilum]SDB03564.1 hypothetical protein SAMN05660653_00160 [Desulfonatronum thiosulfatophilum]